MGVFESNLHAYVSQAGLESSACCDLLCLELVGHDKVCFA
jgi:hypothetical protein